MGAYMDDKNPTGAVCRSNFWLGFKGEVFPPGGYYRAVCYEGSTNVSHFIKFQSDGNLVLYKSGNPDTAIWNSQTGNSGANKFVFEKNGNIAIYKNDEILWQTNTSGYENAQGWLMSNAGNVIVYDWNNDAVFSSPILWKAVA